MKQVKGIALFLAFLMFFTSSGLTISFHYCGSTLENWGVFTQATDCNHEEDTTTVEVTSCCTHDSESLPQTSVSEDCCTTSSETILLDIERTELDTKTSTIAGLLPAIFSILITHYFAYTSTYTHTLPHNKLLAKKFSITQATQCFLI